MAERIISIEIGQRITRVCETDYKGAGNIYAFFLFETPEGLLKEEGTEAEEVFQKRLEEGLVRNKIHTKKAVMSISAVGIGSKEEVVPDVRESKIRDYIQTNRSTFFPLDTKDYQVVFRSNGNADEGMKRVQLYAVPHAQVQSIEALAKSCHLHLLDIGFVENGIAEAMRSAYPDKTIAHIHLEESHTTIIIIEKGEIALARNISYGIDEAVQVLQEQQCLGEDLSYLDVWQQMCDRQCFYSTMQEMEDAEDEDLRWHATMEMRYAISNINRILEYYISKHQGTTFDAVFLTGLGSTCQGMKDLIASEINYRITDITEQLIPQIPKHQKTDPRNLVFATAMVAQTSIGIQLFHGKKGIKGGGELAARKAKKCMFLCLFAALLLVMIPLGRLAFYTFKENSLKTSIASMEKAKEVNDRYQEVLGKYQELSGMQEKTETANSQLLEFLKEMEQGLPTDVVVTELTAEGSELSVYLQAPTKRDAAKTIEVFRSFDSVTNVACEALEAGSDTDGETASSYNFTITCVYVDPETGEAMTEEDETDTADTSDTTNATDAASGEEETE